MLKGMQFKLFSYNGAQAQYFLCRIFFHTQKAYQGVHELSVRFIFLRATVYWSLSCMDQITIKTTNPKGRLFLKIDL
jgi:hypothetical protein